MYKLIAFNTLVSYLAGNILSGNLTAWSWSPLLSLTNAYLYGNQFNGSIPESMAPLVRLSILYLQGNIYLTSYLIYNHYSTVFICLYVYTCMSISSIDNSLTGNIPQSFSGLTSLTRLSLSGNELEGELGSMACSLNQLLRFDVSSNNLIGNISGI